ncbi:MAG: FAD-binding protein [Candidatus Levyibacteriota bacterium]
MNLLDEHNKKVDIIVSQLKSYHKSKENKKIRFTHGSTNSTRVQDKSNFHLIDISSLNQVIKIDNVKNIAMVEPNLPMDKLVTLCLQKGLLPKVVMEFPGITCGGGINGAALEASSFKFGQFNDTCVEYEVVLGSGEVRTVNRKKQADLFYGISGSYGSIALLTLITLELIPARPYVKVSFTPAKTDSLIDSISSHCRKDYDFIEAIVFDREKSLLITGKLSEKRELPLQTFSKAHDEWFYLYAKKQLEKETQTSILVPIQDYLFRYNRGAFWTGKDAFEMFHMPFNRLTRWLLNPFMNTRTMYKGLHNTNLAQNFFIQDFYIPFSQANKFLNLSMDKLGIFPLWLCPLQSTQTAQKLSPHYMKENLLLDIGIWGSVNDLKSGIKKINREFEEYIKQVGGRKMFYANSYYPEEEFWRIYDKKWYTNLRKKYKAEKIFPNIWQKVHTYKEYKIQKWKILKTLNSRWKCITL